MQHAWYIEDRAKQQVGYQRIPQMVRVVPVDTSHEKRGHTTGLHLIEACHSQLEINLNIRRQD